MTHRRPQSRLALALTLSLFAAAAGAETVAPAAPEGAPAAEAPAPQKRKLPNGKWPWFRKYRNQAATPEAAPAPTGSAQPAPASSPETVSELQSPAPASPAPAPPAPPTATRAPQRALPAAPAPAATPAPASAAPAPAPTAAPAAVAPGSETEGQAPPPPRRVRSSRGRVVAPPPGEAVDAPPALPVQSRAMRRFDDGVRRALGIPASWDGAPPVRELTSSPTALTMLEPLQARLAALPVAGEGVAAAHADFGAALVAQGLEPAGAAESLAALRRDPELAAAWNNVATVLRRAGKYDLAEEALAESRRLEPWSGLPVFNLAMLLEAQGRLPEAEATYLEALQLDPRLWIPAHNPLVVGNKHAQRALHRLYLKNESRGGVLLDDATR